MRRRNRKATGKGEAVTGTRSVKSNAKEIEKCPLLKSGELRSQFATAFASSMLVITEYCQICHIDFDVVTKKYVADPKKPFLFACIGILGKDGAVLEDSLFIVKTDDLKPTTMKPLIFHYPTDGEQSRVRNYVKEILSVAFINMHCIT
jgi:hypothetical protein